MNPISRPALPLVLRFGICTIHASVITDRDESERTLTDFTLNKQFLFLTGTFDQEASLPV